MEKEKVRLTHDLDKEFNLVLSKRVSHGDGVGALIRSHRPLNYKAALGLVGLHTDPSLGLGHHLPHRAGQQTKEIVEERGVA